QFAGEIRTLCGPCITRSDHGRLEIMPGFQVDEALVSSRLSRPLLSVEGSRSLAAAEVRDTDAGKNSAAAGIRRKSTRKAQHRARHAGSGQHFPNGHAATTIDDTWLAENV